MAKYAKKQIQDDLWFLKYEMRSDGTVQILGHFKDAPPEGMTRVQAEAITTEFRLETDAQHMVGRVWIKEGQFGSPDRRDRDYIVANPQLVSAYGER